MKHSDQFDFFEEEREKERKAERAERRLKSFAECAIAIDRLFQDALRKVGPSAFDEFLEFARRLSNLSVYNAMLVRLQRPGASAVATEKKWNDIRRSIKPGAIPIVILRPFGPVAFLYEVSDTEGRPLPGEFSNPFVTHGKMDEVEWSQTIKHHRSENQIAVEEMNFGSLLAGNARNLQRLPSKYLKTSGPDSPDWLIQINKNHSVPTRYATFAHELGHIFCGHCRADPKGRWPDRSNLPHAVCEAEAEAVAYLVCARRELDVASNEYLRGLIKDLDLRQVSLYTIFEAANRVEGKLK